MLRTFRVSLQSEKRLKVYLSQYLAWIDGYSFLRERDFLRYQRRHLLEDLFWAEGFLKLYSRWKTLLRTSSERKMFEGLAYTVAGSDKKIFRGLRLIEVFSNDFQEALLWEKTHKIFIEGMVFICFSSRKEL